ncbi:MAG: penicillin acylase family protein [Promethearchaeati archaeon]
MRNDSQNIKKNTIAFSSALIVTILCLVIFSMPLLGFSLGNLLFPGNGLWTVPGEPESQLIYIDGMDDEVTIIRDEWGIPHIYATTDNDLFFAQGYLHAQDRYFQMDLIRRQVRGQLSEILGEGALNQDKLMLAMGMEYWAIKTDQEIRANYSEFLPPFENYVEGINYYLETHKDQKPVEYQLLGFEPKPWTSIDTLCLVQEMARQLSWNYNDLYRYSNWAGLGRDKYLELFNPFQPYQIPIVPNYSSYETTPKFSSSGSLAPSSLKLSVDHLISGIESIDSEKKLIESREITGSNNWVIDGSKSNTGKPILCNDMHLSWILPGVWTEQHLVSEETGINSYGFAIPGMPLVAVGHNEHLAWGFTNTGYDVMDWYYYNEKNSTHYLYEGEYESFETRDYTIKVAGEEDVQFTVRETKEGPVLTDFLGSRIPSNLTQPNIIFAAQWMGNDIFYNLLAGEGFNRAKNRDEFNEASKYWSTLAQNIVYADVDGNIAIRPTGRVPIRDDSKIPSWHLGNGTLPYNGSNGEGKWVDEIPFDKLPNSLNPTQGYLASANQIAVGPEYNFSKYFLQNEYANGYRARRINELLNTTNNISVEKMMEIQLDVNSSAAKAFIPTLIEVIEYTYGDTIPEDLDQAFTILKDWRYIMDKDEAAPTIYRKWRDYFYAYTFNDDISHNNLSRGPMLVMLEYLMNNKTSHWFNDTSTGTPISQTRNQTMLLAFNDTIDWLENFYGTSDASQWKWGDIHKLYFEHLSGLSLLSKGPFPGDGEGYTVNPAGVSIHNGVGLARGGASERMIVDFSDLGNSKSVIPSGQSGHPHLKHYSDQLTELFLKGKYHSQYFYYTPANFPSIETRLIFRPAGGVF